jgi:Tfp pilus assembly protein PilO
MRLLQNQINWCGRAQWTMGIIGVIGLVVFYAGWYRPTARKLETLKLQIQSKQRELEQNQDRAKTLPILAFQVQKLAGEVQAYDRQFPKQPDLGRLIKDITQISQQLALQEWKYQPGAPKKGQAFFELPIQMNFSGDFLNVASFLRQVEDMQRLTRVRKLQLKTRDGKAGTVDVDLTMNVYFSEG